MSRMDVIRPVSDKTLRGRAVDLMKELIVSGELPPGAKLTEIELAQALGISRGPLREAVRELVDIGLLVSKPYKGLSVREITTTDLTEIYSLRTALEQFAFRQCWDKRDAAAREDLRQRNETLARIIEADTDPFGAIEQELVLHSWCYELSGHTLLQQSWERLKPNLQFYFAMHQQAHGRRGPSPRAHDTYIRLACGNDLDAMLTHLEDHMRQGLETTMSFIQQR